MNDDQDAMTCGALDKVLTLTRFPDWHGYNKTTLKPTLPELAALIEQTEGADKIKLPMLSGLTWGDRRSARHSLKHGPNARAVHAVLVDYDAGEIAPGEAAERLKTLNLIALVCTSPSHLMPGRGNRWRILLPLSGPLPPEAYAGLVGRVNGVFGGALADESFRHTQAYFYGSVKGQPPVQTFLVEGSRYINEADDLDEQALGASRPPTGESHLKNRAGGLV